MRNRLVRTAFTLMTVLLFSLGASSSRGETGDGDAVAGLVFPQINLEAIKARGPQVLLELVDLYERSGPSERAEIANVFYGLGWQSEEAKRVLMQDVHTDDQRLRLGVQWALGRVSNDAEIVDVLLANMQDDDNPLFRDKAACALAHDQIHLTEGQKFRLYERVIRALRDPKPQVRDIAIKVLQIHTGQRKGFDPDAPLGQREKRIRELEQWLEEYRSNI